MTRSDQKIKLVSSDVTKARLVGNILLKDDSARVITETGLSVELTNKQGTFFVPQPLFNGEYYSIKQLSLVEKVLARHDIDLLPIDHHCPEWKK